MYLLKEVEIKDFRAIASMKLELKGVNIIVGRNNTGKTSVLEAIALLLSSYNDYKDCFGNNVLKLAVGRGGYSYLKRVHSDIAVVKGHTTNNEVLSLYLATGREGFEKLGTNQLLREAIDTAISEVVEKRFKRILQGLKIDITRSRRRIELLPEGTEQRKAYERELEMMLNRLKRYEEQEDLIKRQEQRKIIDELGFISIILIDNDPIKVHMVFKPESASLFEEEDKEFVELKKYKLPILVSAELLRRRPGRDIVEKLPVDKLIDLIDRLRSMVPYFYDYRNGMVIFNYSDGREIVPLASVGDGFLALLELLTPAILGVNVNVVEEPEIHMHPGFLNQLCRELLKVVNTYNVQYVMATHSLEFLEYLFKYARELNVLNNINVIRMYRLPNGEIDYEILSGEEAIEELEELKGDLRGP